MIHLTTVKSINRIFPEASIREVTARTSQHRSVQLSSTVASLLKMCTTSQRCPDGPALHWKASQVHERRSGTEDRVEDLDVKGRLSVAFPETVVARPELQKGVIQPLTTALF